MTTPDQRGTSPEIANYWTSLDGLRGVAVVAVVLYHFGAPGARGGWLGVDVFFVVSGLVVTTNLRRGASGSGSYRTFIARRSARLYPTLLVAVAAFTLWSVAEDSGLEGSMLGAALASAAQLYNVLVMPFDLDGRAFTPLWSLGIEWQFYLVAPFLVAALARRGRRRAVHLALAGAAVVAAARPIAGLLGVAPLSQYLLTWFRLDGLLLGVAASFWWTGSTARPGVAPRWLAPGAAAGLAGAFVLLPGWYGWQQPSMTWSIPIAGLTTFALVVALTEAGHRSWVGSLLEHRALRFVGERCYSVYLWHFFVGVVVVGDGVEGWRGPTTFVTQIAVTALAGFVSYALVERPARLWLNGRRRRRRTTAALNRT